jgi:hypothetical protein
MRRVLQPTLTQKILHRSYFQNDHLLVRPARTALFVPEGFTPS